MSTTSQPDSEPKRRKRGVHPQRTKKWKAKQREVVKLQKEAAAQAKRAEEAEKRRQMLKEEHGVDPKTLEPIYGYPCLGLDRRSLEAACFKDDWPTHHGGLGGYQHFKNYAAMVWPDVQWNPWLERAIKSLCEGEHTIWIGRTRLRFVSWTGCGGAGKTYAAGFFACAWFSVDPFNTSISLTSTSKTIIGQRVWPVIQHFWTTAKNPETGERLKWGHLINSRKMVEAEKGDEKHSICALAVDSGELQGAVDRIKGRHNPRMMLIVDEANTTPSAIFECISNMAKGCDDLIVLTIGNAVSRLDNHGRTCEPKKGWNSITVDDEEWETAGVPDWAMAPGVALHFDGEKSPNVRAGRTIFPYIYTYENHLADQRFGRDSATYWSQSRGFWPPEGISNTVFSESMIDRFDARGKLTFVSKSTPLSFMDTAFGGDRCIIQFAEMGDLHDGRLGIQLGESIEVQISVKEKWEVDYQVARAFIQANKQRGIHPSHAGLDATGTGRGVAAIVKQEWSDQIHYSEWGGKASDRKYCEEDPRPCRDVYHNKVTELWYSCRELLRSGLIKGFSHQAILEFTIRTFEVKAGKTVLETKEDLRERLHRSPDAADACCGVVELARIHGVEAGGQPKSSEWHDASSPTKFDEEPEPAFASLDDEVMPTSEMEWSSNW